MQQLLLFIWLTYPDLGQSLGSDFLFCTLGETFHIANPTQLVMRRAGEFFEHNVCTSYDPEDFLDRLSETIEDAVTDGYVHGVLTRITWLIRSALQQQCFRAYLGPSGVFDTLRNSINIYAAKQNDPEVSWRALRDALSIAQYVFGDAYINYITCAHTQSHPQQSHRRGFVLRRGGGFHSTRCCASVGPGHCRRSQV